MMPAAKHFDPVIGVDIHIIQPPGPVPPVPVPHPHVGMLIDPADYIPVIGSSVLVNGMHRAIAGTMGKTLPPHIPIGGVFVKPPANEHEMFMGSATVEFDGDAMSHMLHPALSCQCIGMPPPPRLNPKKKSKVKSLVLPTTMVLPIPAGPPVLIGGPPTISLMSLAMNAGMSALGKGLRRLAKSGLARKMGGAFKRARQKVFKKLPPGFLKCKILRAEPVQVVTGEVVVAQEDFTINGRIPLEWQRHYSSRSPYDGSCGYGWETPADARLELEEDGSVFFHDGTPGGTWFDALPFAGPQQEYLDGAVLDQVDDYWVVRRKGGQSYWFRRGEFAGGPRMVERIEDRCGNCWTFIRGEGGLQEIRESAGRSIRVTSHAGRIREMHLLTPGNLEPRLLLRYEYDGNGNLIVVYDALEAPYRFAYEHHRLVRHTDRTGLSFYYEYDRDHPQGRCRHTWGDGDLYNYHFKYYPLTGETEILDSLGHTWRVLYNRDGLITHEIDPLGGAALYEYDEVGRTTAVIDPLGLRTEYTYDAHGNLVQLIRPDGSAISTRFNPDHLAEQITDPNGAVWKQEWDARGLLVRQLSPAGAESRFEYDGWGQLTGHSNPLGARTALAFDSAGNLIRLTDALGHASEFEYDVLGNLTARIDALGQRTEYRYDAKGRLTGSTLPGGSRIACEYDGEDNLVRYRDENGAVTRLEYFGLGEICRRIQPDGQVVAYHYDTEERLTGVTNQRGERYHLQRDPLGQITEEIDYWGQARRYVYNAAGFLLQSIDPSGRVIHYQTDPLGRILRKFLPDPANPGGVIEEIFQYDPNGNLIACENSAIRIERKFDPEGRLLEEQQGAEAVIRFSYDAAGNRTAREAAIDIGGRQYRSKVTYGYDALDQAIAVEAEGHDPLRLTRDARGQITSEALGSRLRRDFRYSPEGFLTAQRVLAAEGPLFEQQYRYDRTGNLIEKRDSAYGTDLYTYDPLGRLLSHLNPEGQFAAYRNDPAGDRLGTQISEGSPDSAADAAWAREGEYEGVRYRFDRNGNLVARSGAQGKTRLKWDAHQQLCESITDGRVTYYHYDPLGRRISKETTGVVTRFFWDGDVLLGDVLVEENIAPILPRLREWIYYPGTFEPLALRQSVDNAAPELYLYHNDPNGCPTRLLNLAGEVVWAAQYRAWGEAAQLPVNRVDNPLRLQGQYADGETGLYYNRHRYFDSWPGQFISCDPLGLLAGENFYQFAYNILNWIDPYGLACGKKGKGMYSDVKGHHVHAKAGFKGHAKYDPEKGFSISQDYMASRGWSHQAMTSKQRELFDKLAASGKANTLAEHSRIARESLIAGGATSKQAQKLVQESLGNLKSQGVKAPSHIPWN